MAREEPPRAGRSCPTLTRVGGSLSSVRFSQGPRGTGRHEHPPLQRKKPRLGEMPGLVSVGLSPSAAVPRRPPPRTLFLQFQGFLPQYGSLLSRGGR